MLSEHYLLILEVKIFNSMTETKIKKNIKFVIYLLFMPIVLLYLKIVTKDKGHLFYRLLLIFHYLLNLMFYSDQYYCIFCGKKLVLIKFILFYLINLINLSIII